MPKVSIDTSLNTVQVVKSGNDLQKTMDKLGRSIEKTFDGRKASGLGDALKPLTQELAKIMTQAGDTAAQIKALEKTIVAAENTRGKLAESLGKAKTEAEQTAAELEKTYANADKAAYALEKINSEIHAAHDKGQLPSDTALLKRSDLTEQLTQADAKIAELEAKLEQQNSTAAKITAEFESQRQSLEGMTQRHAELARRMEQEQAAAANQAETLQRAQTMQAGDDAMQQYFNKQAADIEKQYAKIAAAQEKAYGPETATHHAEKVVAATKKEIAAQEAAAEAAKKHAAAEAGQEAGNASSTGGASDSAKRASSAFGVFAKRLKSIVFSALIFNVISSALRSLTSALGSAVAKTDGFGTALARLKGAAATAAAPLVNALGSALTYVMNLAAKAFAYLAKLISLLTGKSLSGMQATAKKMTSVGTAASGMAKQTDKAAKSLAGFDEIERLGLEVYYNGDRAMTEFKIKCYKRVGTGWRYVGMYTPDFLIIQRRDGKIYKAIITETKGQIYANDPAFIDKRTFMETEFSKYNNSAFGYRRFDYLYLEDTLTETERIQITHKKICDFFKEKIL